MKEQLYTYANILRYLRLDETEIANSVMIDINTEDDSILSIFDARRPFDAAFIQSYLNILSQSSIGFKLTEDATLLAKARSIAATIQPAE